MSSIVTVLLGGKGGDSCWRTWCSYVQDAKLHPSACFKVSVVILLGPVLFLSAVLIRGGGILEMHGNSPEPWSMILGRTSTRGFPTASSSTSRSRADVERPACLSRIQHMLPRPPSQIIPRSPTLASALTAYEKHHAECSRSLGQNWTQTFLRSWDHQQNASCQFLVYVEGGAGLGNRLIALVSAFLFALLTNRVFLVDSNSSKGHIANLLCEPFRDSSWVLPEGFPFQQLDRSPSLGEAIDQDFNVSVMKLKLNHAQSWGDQRFFCKEARDRIKSVTWISWRSNQYVLPRFFTFPEFWPRLGGLFPDPSLAFTYLSRYLLLPTNSLWEKIFRIHSSYLASSEKLVGIQIRRHSVDNSGDFSPAAFERILRCAVDHHVLPNTSSAVKFSVENFLDRMKLREKRGLRNGVTAVLIASLQQKYAEELQDLYTNFPTTDGSLVRVHMVSHEGMEWHSYDQAQKAFVEMWLLSLSDTIATSSWSTFGYVAQGLGALRPYILNVKGNLDNSNSQVPLCFVGQSAEPCNHFSFWPKTDCSNASTLTSAHEEWIAKHISRCQDEDHGIQLV